MTPGLSQPAGTPLCSDSSFSLFVSTKLFFLLEKKNFCITTKLTQQHHSNIKIYTMKFNRKSHNTDHVIIVKCPIKSLEDKMYQVIPSSEKHDEFLLHKNYVSKIFGKKKNFLSEYEDESSHIIFEITWHTWTKGDYLNITIDEHELIDNDEED
jgi:hypothetical protein